MQFEIQPASKQLVKVRILMSGVSGSGKTLGALYLAKGLCAADNSKVVLIDTETPRGNDHAGKLDYMVMPFPPPHTTERAIQALEFVGKEVPNLGAIIFDSASHIWTTLSDEKDEYELTHKGGNTWANWKLFTPRWNKFLIDAIGSTPCHCIVTARGKTQWVVEGKTPVKVGVDQKLRDGSEFEFNIHMNIDHSTHRYVILRDSWEIDWEKAGAILNEDHGKMIYDYLQSETTGKPSRKTMKNNLAARLSGAEIKHLWELWLEKNKKVTVTTPQELDDEMYGKFVDWAIENKGDAKPEPMADPATAVSADAQADKEAAERQAKNKARKAKATGDIDLTPAGTDAELFTTNPEDIGHN